MLESKTSKKGGREGGGGQAKGSFRCLATISSFSLQNPFPNPMETLKQ